mgnify:CR=1 FL=1
MIKGFTTANWKKQIALMPREDSYSIDQQEGIVAVADGVTRDPLKNLPNSRTLAGKIKFAFHYPRPSPAAVAANIFTRTFPQVLQDYLVFNRNQEAIRNAFAEANKRISDWNKDNIPAVDYIKRDFAGCVSAGAVKLTELVSFGYLTDCGVAIFDENGNLKFRTENQGPDKYDKNIWKDLRLQRLEWADPKARKIVRSEYRNNPEEENSFGVLTGEETAMHYVRTGTHEIKPDETLIVYSDGLEPVIFSGDFSDKLKQKDFRGLEKICRQKVKTEGTLIYFK